MSNPQQYRRKGKLLTEKAYKRRLKQRETGRNNRKYVPEAKGNNPPKISGCRILDMEVMSERMKCFACKDTLTFENLQKESKQGLASIFHIKCGNCLLVNKVPSSKEHVSPTGYRAFDVNTRAALGALHSGLGHTHVEKFLGSMEIPTMNSTCFKQHEREDGPVAEAVAKETCREAVAAERELTILKKNELEETLPIHLRSGFLMPSEVSASDQCDERPAQTDENGNIVRLIFSSFDMGWSKRGTGRQYDSLNGYASLIGTLSGRVLDFTTRNRKCAKCDKGHAPTTHSCRLNFQGSAKAMEPHAAADLVANSSILKEANVQVGVLIGDDDSSSILAVRKASSHQVVKQSDENHTSKGVKALLYKIDKQKDPDRELNAEAIQYSHRCFTYALAQNKGNRVAMTAAIKNIPFHAFDVHDDCGDWCEYLKDPEIYRHKTITGFKNPVLFEELKSMFAKLSSNTDKFVAGASSQANESLNGVMSKKAPKSICYSMSESADFRYACFVAQKNKGEGYVREVLKKIDVNVGSHSLNLVKRVSRKANLRSQKTATREFKVKGQILKKERTKLRNKKNATDGLTYKSNVRLIDIPAINNFDGTCAIPLPNESPASSSPCDFQSSQFAVVFFDLETSCFSKACDILQIAMKCNNLGLTKYMNPTRPIPPKVSEINGLTNEQGDLLLHGERVVTSPLEIVFDDMFLYLQRLTKPCILVAHNCIFDEPRSIRALKNTNSTEKFSTVIQGFVDTLPIFRKKFPDRASKSKCTLTSLATDLLSLDTSNAHNADAGVFMLQQLVIGNFKVEEIIAGTKSFKASIDSYNSNVIAKDIWPSFEPMKGIISKAMQSRLAQARISYDLIKETYRIEGKNKVVELLEQKSRANLRLSNQRKFSTSS